MSAPPGPLAPDLVVALKRLKLSRVRAIAPEVLATAKTQRWAPEEILRTLVEAEIAARDAANQANRLRVAGFPLTRPWRASSAPTPRSRARRSTTWRPWNGSAPPRTYA